MCLVLNCLREGQLWRVVPEHFPQQISIPSLHIRVGGYISFGLTVLLGR